MLSDVQQISLLAFNLNFVGLIFYYCFNITFSAAAAAAVVVNHVKTCNLTDGCK